MNVNYLSFHNNRLVGRHFVFPERYQVVHEKAVIYEIPTDTWWLMDVTPLHIDSVPKVFRVLALIGEGT